MLQEERDIVGAHREAASYLLADAVGTCISRPVPRIPLWILGLPGYGTSLVLDLLNNVCRAVVSLAPPALPGRCLYVEFGAWCGRSLSAAAYGNEGLYVGVDNFSQFQVGPVRETLAEAVGGCARVLFLEGDHRDFKTLPRSVDVFFYDSDHGIEPTAAALEHMVPMLASPSVVLIDDIELGNVAEGVTEGLKRVERAGLRVVRSWALSRKSGYHEGLYVAVVEHESKP